MRTGAGRIVACCVVVCVLAASCSCFRVRTTLAAEAAEPFAGGESPGDNDHRREPAADPVAPHCNDVDGDRQPRWFLGIDWRRAGSGMADHWWIVAVSSLLSLAVLWRIQCNVRKKVTDGHTCRANPAAVAATTSFNGLLRVCLFQLQQWKRLPLQKDQRAAYNGSRRLTLPDLTLAKHARRESLAEASLKSSSEWKFSIKTTSYARSIRPLCFIKCIRFRSSQKDVSM